MDDADVVIEPEGDLRVQDEALRQRLAPHHGDFVAAVASRDCVILRRAGENAPHIQMAGEIVTRMTVMEICNIIATSGWVGELSVLSPAHQRVLTFDQGALKFARSDAPNDRLGAVLFRMGLIDRDAMTTVAAEVGEKRFGELAVEQALIDAQQLYQALQRQAEDIFFGALVVSRGSYVFLLPNSDDDQVGTAVHLNVQGLLMEGVQRIDEMALFRDKVPSTDMCPVPRESAPPPRKLDETAQLLLESCNGDRTIGDLMRMLGINEFAATKGVYHLVQSRQVELRAPTRVDPVKVRHLVGRFNEVLQDIFVAVATYGGLTQTRQTLEAWIMGSGYGPYFGEGVDEFGAIDPERVVESLQGVDAEHPLEALHQGLHELAAFALFSATTALPRDQELSLARDVNTRLKAIRIE